MINFFLNVEHIDWNFFLITNESFILILFLKNEQQFCTPYKKNQQVIHLLLKK